MSEIKQPATPTHDLSGRRRRDTEGDDITSGAVTAADNMLTARALVEAHIAEYGMVPHPDKMKEAIAAALSRDPAQPSPSGSLAACSDLEISDEWEKRFGVTLDPDQCILAQSPSGSPCRLGRRPSTGKDRAMKPLEVGKVYRLRFPGIAARVLPNPPGTVVTMDDGSPGYLIETLFTKSRWWVRGDGKPNNHCSPWLVPRRER